MVFLTGQDLATAISELIGGTRLHCAVAFWGAGSERLFKLERREDFKIICNLKMGGTNPWVIKRLPRGKVKQLDTLHAKVYIGDNFAIVGSANASANGLGLEGEEQGTWIEAGVKVVNIDSICAWFDALWNDAQDITSADIEVALVLWERRQRTKPGIKPGATQKAPSLAGFEVSSSSFPLITWVSNGDWEPNEPELKKAYGYYNEKLYRRVEEGIEIEHESERKILKPNRWVLVWERTSRGLPKKRASRWWVNLSQTIDQAFRHKGERRWRPAALQAEVIPPVPFDIHEDKFDTLFTDLLCDDRYVDLRTSNYSAWFTAKRLRLMREFWGELKTRYVQEG